MEDEYGMADLRHYMSSRPLFPPMPQPPPPDLLSSHRGLNHPYDMLIFRSDSPAAANNNASSSAAHCYATFDGGLNGGGGDGGAGRWPRQETLTLLEIRSRLDLKFKEANQKGPLWDEVSRIMCEEHGYQRTGKKCREKFENLYKYYKKTKEGKAGRQDGKHYRFFRQLEALYGEANNSTTSASMSEAHLYPNYCNKGSSSTTTLLARGSHDAAVKLSDTSLSLSNYSDAEDSSSSSEESGGIDDREGKVGKRRGGGWKVKIKNFIDAQMKKLMEKQEVWMEKMMSTIEEKERERLVREEEWRKQDAARVEREHNFWASERAWIEARDAALMEALQKMTAEKEEAAMAAEIRSLKDDGSETITAKSGGDIWPESEINRLIQLTSAMEGKLEQRGAAEEMAWEEIATKMGCFGHERSAAMCKEKWDTINNYVLKCSKKRKDNSKTSTYFHAHGGGGEGGVNYCDNNEQAAGNDDHHQNHRHHHHHHHNLSLSHDHGSSSPNPNAAAGISESCFRYFMGDTYGRIID